MGFFVWRRKEHMTALLGILAGVLALATALLLWRSGGIAKERDAALRAREEAKADAETIRRESRAARDELETKRREVSDLRTERDDLKKKIFDAKEEAKRRLESQSKRQEDDRDTRYRELAATVQMLRDDLTNTHKRREEAEKALLQEREKVRSLEHAAGRAAQKPAREERPVQTRPTAEPASHEGLTRELEDLKRKLAERERSMETLRRKADNANRIYLMTKSQLDLAQEKIATLGLRYAEVLAKLEGRPPPLGAPEPQPAADAAAEAEAMAAAMDESEPPAPADANGAGTPAASSH
jgi:chromosome segregation ATPase